jgi:glyoxylase-like metal-dependent hydrolase (beta-lactamase superfamily II)
MRVRHAGGEHLLTGDACYFCQNVENRRFPDFADAAAMNVSLDKLLALRGPETVMVFGHDPSQWGERPVLPSTREAVA